MDLSASDCCHDISAFNILRNSSLSLGYATSCVTFCYQQIDFIGARNFIEAVYSFGSLAFVGASGMHPVILTLFTLRKDQQGLEWFPLLISSLCALISWSSVLITYSRTFKTTDLLQDGYNPQQCGGINPAKYCFPLSAISINDVSKFDVYWWQSLSLSKVLSPYSGIAMLAAILLLLVEKILTEKDKRVSIESGAHKRAHRARTWMRRLRQLNMLRYLGLVLAIAEAWHVYATFCLLFIVSSLINSPFYQLTENWTLGQIMAVAIWAPVIIEWIRVLLEGIIKDRIASRKKGRRTDYIEMGPTSNSPNADSQVQLRPPPTDNQASQADPDPSPPRLSLQSIGSNNTASWGIPPGAPSGQASPYAQV